MPPALTTRRGCDPAATTPLPRVGATLGLSARTLAWLAERPLALVVVESVWRPSPSWKQPGTIRACWPLCGSCWSTTSRPGRVVAVPAAGEIGAGCGAGANFPVWCGARSGASCWDT